MPAARDWRLTIAVVLAAALPGVLLLPVVVPVARWLDTEPGLIEYTGLSLAWKLSVLVVLAAAVAPGEGRPLRDLIARWWQREHREEDVGRPVALWALLLVLAAIGLSSVRLWLIDLGWDLAAGPEWSINTPEANRGIVGFAIGPGVVAFQLLIRIPLTVFVEETLFRGWVQERHGPFVSGTLFAAYHLAQWWTIPALIPFGLALSLLRVATRSIWPGALLHGAGNAVYAFSLR